MSYQTACDVLPSTPTTTAIAIARERPREGAREVQQTQFRLSAFSFNTSLSASQQSLHSYLEDDSEPEEQIEVEGEGEEWRGHSIKCLPNGMRRLPTPSIVSTSCDHLPNSLVQPEEESTLDISGPCSSPTPSTRLRPDTRIDIASTTMKSHTSSSSSSSTSSSSSLAAVSSSNTSAHCNPDCSSSLKPPQPLPQPYAHMQRKPLLLQSSHSWGANFWTLIRDPANEANNFFANPSTGECRWTLPRGTVVLPPNPDGEWWELFDELTGREYYYHTVTRERKWSRPGGGGVIIPLAKIQVLGHARRSFSEGGGERGVRGRTKSLQPQSQQRGLRFHTPEVTLTTGGGGAKGLEEEQLDEDLASRARRSIVLHDQRALKLAREAAKAPFFHPHPHPDSAPVRRSPSKARRRRCVSRSKKSRTANVSEEVPIRKLGKGYACEPHKPVMPRRKSLPILCSESAKPRKREREIVGLPFDVASALVSSRLREAEAAEEKERAERKETKMNKLFKLPSFRLAFKAYTCSSSTSEDKKTSHDL